MDILDRTKYQGTFGVDPMSQWTFWTGPNVLQRQLVVLMMLQKPKYQRTDFKILSGKRHNLKMSRLTE